ncbi:MAG: hypothetical protein HC933_18055 [Pleurocapsa sp. SU_196_0]|nr:hypothetical protein [Pleurocapsa sp. SU_196_0]
MQRSDSTAVRVFGTYRFRQSMILAGRSFNMFVSARSTRDIAAFLQEPETRQRFEDAFHATRDPDDLKVLSLAEQFVRF